MPVKPGVTIDFTRQFSLPAGIPVDLPAADLATYLGELGSEAEFVYLDRPARRPLDPEFSPAAGSFRLRFLPFGPDQLVVPRSAGLVPALPAAELTLPKARVADSGGPWVEAVEVPGRSMAEVAAGRFRWDPQAAAAAPLPQPLLSDESLSIYWPDEPARGPLLAAPLNGIAEDDAATHLLASSDTTRDGELERTLVRAPARGLIRFERYRHLVLRGGRLTVGQPSASGAWVLRLPAGGIAFPAVVSPLEDPRTLVIEHVAIDYAIECTARIALLHVLRAGDILAGAAYRDAMRWQLSWLFRSWLAWLKVVAPTTRPGEPDPSPGIPAAVRAPFEASAQASRSQILAMRTHVLGDATARASLTDFITSFYAALLCGRSWPELGVDLPTIPSARPAALRPAHKTLEHLTRSSSTWLLSYAGCPLGRPARVYAARTPPAPMPPRPLGQLTTFDLEALAVAGMTTAEYPDITAPDTTDPLEQVDLSAFAGESPGVLAVFRAVDAAPPFQEFTTFDWLSELVKGAHRALRQEPRVDFADYAAAGHPLADPLLWPLREDAVELHERMKRLHTTVIAGRALSARTIDWWGAATGLLDGAGTWPALTPAAGDTRTPPGPSAPYKPSAFLAHPSPIPWGEGDGDTGAGVPRVTGFDEFEIEAVLRAGQVTRNGKTLLADLDPALLLALLEREGYRRGASGERVGTVRVITAPFDASVRMAARNAGHLGLMTWLIFPFGLDMVVRNKPLQAISFSASDIVTRTRANFRDHFTVRLDPPGLVDPAAELLIDWETALRYLRGRRIGTWTPTGLAQHTASRGALWMSVVIQQATFQWVHRLLHQATTPRGGIPPLGGNPYVQVPELVAGTVPDVGASADSVERRRYLAYWALVYLAFNVEETTWNAWVNAVPAAAIAAGTSVSEYLLYHHNSAPGALEPPGGLPRLLGQRGNMLRFAVALDAYLRLRYGAAAEDVSAPGDRTWPVVP